MPTLTLRPSGRTITVPAGANLLDACHRAGIGIPASCGGKGLCGKCRVRILRGETPGEMFRRPLDAGEDGGEPVPLVIGGGGLLQRLDRGQRHHEQRDPRCDDHADCEHLAPQAPKVPPQLSTSSSPRSGPTTSCGGISRAIFATFCARNRHMRS